MRKRTRVNREYLFKEIELKKRLEIKGEIVDIGLYEDRPNNPADDKSERIYFVRSEIIKYGT